jgi:N-acetylglutamate synthase-like GNAT family acetyltransferase
MMIRQAESADIGMIASTHVRELGRQIDTRRLDAALNRYPAVIAEQQGRMIGFAFSSPMAPDILQLTNMMIARNWRGQGHGTELLGALEALAAGRYQAIVIANSTLYRNHHEKKRSAESFYLRAGYQEILTTEATKLFSKRL